MNMLILSPHHLYGFDELLIALEAEGYQPLVSQDLAQSLASVAAQPLLGAILNTENLSLETSLSLCRQLAQPLHLTQTPLVVLNGIPEIQNGTPFLDEGADTVLKTPVVIPELLARLRALTRLRPTLETKSLTALHLLHQEERLIISGREVPLSPIEFRLLAYFCRHLGHYLTAEDLLIAVWGYPPQVGDTALVRNHIRNLRRKLEQDPDHPQRLVSRYRQGYCLQAVIVHES